MKNSKLVNKKYINLKKLFLIFVLMALVGNIYEILIIFVKHLIKNGDIFLKTRQRLLYFPITPIYGFGAVIMTLFFADKKYKWYQIIIIGALLGGVFEFLSSLFLEKVFGIVSWNFKNHPFNKFLYPLICKLLRKIPKNTLTEFLFYVLVLFISLDSLITFLAIGRQNLRHEKKKAYTFIGEICDRLYDDEKLDKIFPKNKKQ